MALDIITRAALGSSAPLGALYDVKTDSFCGYSVIEKDIPIAALEIINTSFADIQIATSDDKAETFSKLNISAELQVSLLLGMVTLGGSGLFLSDTKQSSREVRSSLIYNIKTKTETFNPFHEELKTAYYLEALRDNHRCTHFVGTIEWGANTILSGRHSNSENATQIGHQLRALLKSVTYSIQENANVSFKEPDISRQSEFQLRIFGDVLPQNKLPTTVEGAMQLLKNMSHLIRDSSNGLGKPVQYTLIPLTMLRNFLSFDDGAQNIAKSLHTEAIERITQYFNSFDAAKRKVNDLYTDALQGRNYISFKEWEGIASLKHNAQLEEARVRAEISNLVHNARSGANNATETLDEYLSKADDHTYSPSNLQSMLDSWKHVEARLNFAKWGMHDGTGMGYNINDTIKRAAIKHIRSNPRISKVQWVKAYNGDVAPGAMKAAIEKNDDVYIARTVFPGETIACRIVAGGTYCAHNWEETQVYEYDVLVAPIGATSWVLTRGDLPKGAISTDVNWQICRFPYDKDVLVIGKFHHGECRFTLGGEEMVQRKWVEILVDNAYI